jgi:hypothetical protein
MKIQINKQGSLLIERAGKMKSQVCPFSFYSAHIDDWVYCGDWCPHFRTEEAFMKEAMFIHLCHKTEYWCDKADFTDNRNTQGN